MDRTTAERLPAEAESMNKGSWIAHSRNVACLAEKIADKAGMDHEQGTECIENDIVD